MQQHHNWLSFSNIFRGVGLVAVNSYYDSNSCLKDLHHVLQWQQGWLLKHLRLVLKQDRGTADLWQGGAARAAAAEDAAQCGLQGDLPRRRATDRQHRSRPLPHQMAPCLDSTVAK